MTFLALQRVFIAGSVASLILLAGCVSRPANERITSADLESSYGTASHIAQRPQHDPSTLLVLAFSGGGKRAAALSYGVLEELRRTIVVVDGQQRQLLDDVDIIAAVSGGSFTALAYALYGERLFSEYETRFLKRNVQGTLIERVLNPANWPNLAGSSYGRSELAADYYDEILFEGATFGDLAGKPTPAVIASATELTTGSRFPFSPEAFNLICSDFAKMRLSRAAAASSAVPVVLSPVTLDNYGDQCGFQFPAWVQEGVAKRSERIDVGRALRRYDELVALQDSAAHPYLHLIDGGVSDNVAIRGIVEVMTTIDSKDLNAIPLLRDVRRIAVIVVNAASSPTIDWARSASPPGIFQQLWQSSSVPIDLYSYESIDLLNDIVTRWALERELAAAKARLGGTPEASTEANRPFIELYAIDVSFRDIPDPNERAYFANLPTTLALASEDVDKLRSVAGRILRASPAYRRLLDALGVVAATAPASRLQ